MGEHGLSIEDTSAKLNALKEEPDGAYVELTDLGNVKMRAHPVGKAKIRWAPH